MIVAAFTKGAEHFCNVYYNWEHLHIDTFSPECVIDVLIELDKAKGETYAEKKRWVQDRAIEYSNARSELFPLSLWELCAISNWFEKYGRRYGLLKEFHENCIC